MQTSFGYEWEQDFESIVISFYFWKQNKKW